MTIHMRNIGLVFSLFGQLSATYGPLQPCCSKISISGSLHEELEGVYTKAAEFINGRLYYIRESDGSRGNYAIWFNRLGHWIVGYENDARQGYSSGTFYSSPTNNMERKCPQNSQTWFEWSVRSWSAVGDEFSLRCTDDVDVQKQKPAPTCTLITASCSGPWFTITLNADCRDRLEPFQTFDIESFTMGSLTSRSRMCKFRRNNGINPTIEFNAGQCDTRVSIRSNLGLSYQNTLYYKNSEIKLTEKTLECKESPSWWSSRHQSRETIEYSYNQLTKTIEPAEPYGAY